MLANRKPTRIEWMCTQCGKKITKAVSDGRPEPGTCPRKPNKKPHSWVQNRKL